MFERIYGLAVESALPETMLRVVGFLELRSCADRPHPACVFRALRT
jgi:hypothetical protein